MNYATDERDRIVPAKKEKAGRDLEINYMTLIFGGGGTCPDLLFSGFAQK